MRFKAGPRRWGKKSVAAWAVLAPSMIGDILQGIAILEVGLDNYVVVKLESQRIDSDTWQLGRGEKPVGEKETLDWPTALAEFIKRTTEEQR